MSIIEDLIKNYEDNSSLLIEIKDYYDKKDEDKNYSDLRDYIINNDFSNLDDRWGIFLGAFTKVKGYKDVKKELDKKGLKDIYIRDPYEYVVYLCLKNNDDNSICKIDLEKFSSILHHCLVIYENYECSLDISLKTINDIRDYLERYSKKSADNSFDTNTITMNMLNEVKNIKIDANEYKDIETNIINSYLNKIELLISEYSSSQYYFIKYAYYYMLSQIAEFIYILKTCSYKGFGYLKDHYDNPKDLVYGDYNFSDNVGIYYLYDLLCDCFIDYLDRKETDLLRSLTDSMCIGGGVVNSDKLSDSVRTLFMQNNKITFSNICKINGLFENESYKKAIYSLKVEDFFDFKISWEQFYKLIFSYYNELPDDKNDRTKGRKLGYTVYGQYDFNRTLFIYYMMVINHAIKWDTSVIDSLINHKDCLMNGCMRINSMLLRCGYPKLDSDTKLMDAIVEYSFSIDNKAFYNDLQAFLDIYKEQFNELLISPEFEIRKTEKKRDIIRRKIKI